MSFPADCENLENQEALSAEQTQGHRSSLSARALKLWRDREMQFPPRVRRMNPDALDRMSGAWDLCLFQAKYMGGGR